MSKPPLKRVVEALAICQNCSVPVYEPVDKDTMYRIILSNFILGGGDSYTMIRDHAEQSVTVGKFTNIDICNGINYFLQWKINYMYKSWLWSIPQVNKTKTIRWLLGLRREGGSRRWNPTFLKKNVNAVYNLGKKLSIMFETHILYATFLSFQSTC